MNKEYELVIDVASKKDVGVRSVYFNWGTKDQVTIQLLSSANENVPRTESEKQEMIKQAAHHYGKFLQCLGFDYEADENSKDTPRRVAKAWVNDLIAGCVDEPPKITAFPSNGYEGVVFQGDIPIVSMCSHHNLAFTGKAHVAYIPSKEGKVIGLSKLNRIVDFYARRPQIQEGLTVQIHQHVDKVCEHNQGVAVMIEANHTCCSNRGIKHDSTMKTAHLTGFFKEDVAARNEFYSFISDLK